ncbi:MAG: hypothetical protein JWR13_4056, partial [Mycobacterium sp.]|nr:hypothetical protein [Mycobacterium sp.]
DQSAAKKDALNEGRTDKQHKLIETVVSPLRA